MNKFPDLSELVAFAAVARHRSFRKAAAERGVSASALSHTLRNLEERLGVRLLHRTTRSVTPTEAGQHLLSTLAPALDKVQNALADLSAMQDVPGGRLRLNVPRMAARITLAPLLARFIQVYPRVQVEVTSNDQLTDIIGEGYDAGVRFGEHLADGMVAMPLGEAHRFCVVAESSWLAQQTRLEHPRDLLQYPCINRMFPGGNFYAWEFQQAGNLFTVQVNGSLAFDDNEAIMNAVLHGAGFGYLSEQLVHHLLAQQKLLTVLDSWIPPASHFYLYYSGRRQLPAPLRAFVDFIRENR